MARKKRQTSRKSPMTTEAVSSQRQQHLTFVNMMREVMEPEVVEPEVIMPPSQNDSCSTDDRDI